MGDKFRPDTDDSLKATLIMYFQGLQMRFKCLAVSPLFPILKFKIRSGLLASQVLK